MDKIRALILDDKKIIGDFFDFTLGYMGHKIKVVNNLQEALDLVKGEKFDIAFIDIVMPETDGINALEQIKRISPDLPVVMMSGYSVEDKRCHAKELGAVTCLKKPFEMDDVREAVKLAIGKEI